MLEKLVLDTENTLLVDVRTLEEFNQIHAENTINIDSHLIDQKIDFFKNNKGKNFILFCHSGIRSMQIVKYLTSIGIPNVYDAGTVNHIIAIQQKKINTN